MWLTSVMRSGAALAEGTAEEAALVGASTADRDMRTEADIERGASSLATRDQIGWALPEASTDSV
jgi:hypothetical protein